MADFDDTTSRPVVTLEYARRMGLARYFTGMPCKSGHIAERKTVDRGCVPCGLERSARWRLENHERARAQRTTWLAVPGNKERRAETSKVWGSENSERKRENSRRWSAENPGRHIFLRKRWLVENADYRRDWHRQYRQDNKATQAEAGRAWRKLNREAANTIARNRRARIRSAEGKHTAAEIIAQLAKQSGKCYYCFVVLKNKKHADHYIAIANGGANDIENIVISCQPCNNEKHTMHPLDFIRKKFKRLL